MKMGKKILVAILGSLILAVLAFMGYIMKNYGDFSNIPHYDVTMWIFWIVLGILIVLVLLAVILLYALSLQDQEEPVEDGSYLEISDEIQEEPAEEAVETPVEEETEEEAPEALQVDVPELSEMNIDELEPEEQAERKEAAVESPAIWEEEKFE